MQVRALGNLKTELLELIQRERELTVPIEAGGVSGSKDALDILIYQCETVENRLGGKDYENAVLDGDLTLASVLRASAWELHLIGGLAKKLKSEIKEKTIEEHRAEFELWAEGEDMRTYRHSFLNGSFYTLRDTEKEWLAWQAARGISE